MVTLVDHRSLWKTEFRGIAAVLRDVLGAQALRIDHIGSTAVPKLCAKDVIDIQLTVVELQAPSGALRSAGFTASTGIRDDHVPPDYAGPPGDWSKAFFTEPAGGRRSNIHVRLAGKPNQRYALLFRDYLRSHAATAQAYGELKRRLARSLASASDYADVKDPAVDLIYLAAEAWAAHTGWQPPPSDA